MTHNTPSSADEWQDLYDAPTQPLQPPRVEKSREGFLGSGDGTGRAEPRREETAAAPDVGAILQAATVRPLCICANQKFNRIAVGHERGFLVFHVEQDRAETFEELLLSPTQSTSSASASPPSAAAAGTKGVKSKKGNNNNSSNSEGKPSLSHLVLDPFYNTDELTFSAIKRRMQAHHQRLQQQQLQERPGGRGAKDARAAPVAEEPRSLCPAEAASTCVDSVAMAPPPPAVKPCGDASLSLTASLPPSSVEPSLSLRAYGEEVSDVMVSDDSMVVRAHQRRREEALARRKRQELAQLNEMTGTGTAAMSRHQQQGQQPEADTSNHSSSFRSAYTISEVNRRTRLDTPSVAATVEEAVGTLPPQPPVSPPSAFYEDSESEDEEERSSESLSGMGNDDTHEDDALLISRVEGSNLNLFLSLAHNGPSPWDGTASARPMPRPIMTTAMAKERTKTKKKKSRENMERADGNGSEHSDNNLPEKIEGKPEMPELAWDDSDADEGKGRSALDGEVGGVANSMGLALDAQEEEAADGSSRFFGVVTERFLHGEEPIGFYGGGVSAIALQYEQSQIALVGGGPTPMRRQRQWRRCSGESERVECRDGECAGCDVFVLCNGCCRQVLTLSEPVTKVMLDARVLFILTRRKLCVYTDPMDPTATRCGAVIPFTTTPLHSSLPSAAATRGHLGEQRLDSADSTLSVYPPSSTFPTPATAAPPGIASSPATPPCVVVDYTRNLILLRGPHSALGFSLYRYTTFVEEAQRRTDSSSSSVHQASSEAEKASDGATGEQMPPLTFLTGRTAVHVKAIAALPMAHKNPLASLAMSVGPPMDGSQGNDDTAKLFGRESVYVAAASEYATRITVWKLAAGATGQGGNGDAAQLLTFVLQREFRVGFRLPPVATHFFQWGRASSNGGSLQQQQQQMSPAGTGSPLSTLHEDPTDASFCVEANESMAESSSGAIKQGIRAAAATTTTVTQSEEDNHVMGIHHLQFLHQGQFLLCVRRRSMLVFSNAEVNPLEARNVCQEHPKAMQNKQSRLASVNQLVKGLLDTSFLSSYTRQAWASCQGKLPLSDSVFYPRCLVPAMRGGRRTEAVTHGEADRDARDMAREGGQQGGAVSLLPPPRGSSAEQGSSTGGAEAGGPAKMRKRVTGWLSSKLFNSTAATATAGNKTDEGSTSTLAAATSTCLASPQPQQQQQQQQQRQSQRGTNPPPPPTPPTVLPSVAKCILIWEHDTPASFLTLNYDRFGPANVPGHAASEPPHSRLQAAGSTDTAIPGESQESKLVSVGPGGRTVAKKIVLDCATCDGAFVNVRLYTDTAQLVCSPAVPFQLK